MICRIMSVGIRADTRGTPDSRRDSGLGPQQKGAHHLVVLVFKHVTVPDEAAGLAVEGDDDTGDVRRRAQNDVLPALFFGGRGDGAAGKDDFRCAPLTGDIESPAVEELKVDGMQMNRVSI